MYGLRVTDSLKLYSSKRSSFPHSPFRDKKILYPFLVIEAKSEKGSPGFESIEAQSALAIRSCVLLQRRLEAKTSIPLHPLVWFIAYQGDEWRLYAGIPDGENIVSDPPRARE